MNSKNRKEGWRQIKAAFAVLLLLIPTIFVILPIILLATGSVMGTGELREYLTPVFGESAEFIRWKLVPDYPTFENYGKLLFLTPLEFHKAHGRNPGRSAPGRSSCGMGLCGV